MNQGLYAKEWRKCVNEFCPNEFLVHTSKAVLCPECSARERARKQALIKKELKKERLNATYNS